VLSHAALQTHRYIWAFKGIVPELEAQGEETGSGGGPRLQQVQHTIFWIQYKQVSKSVLF